MTVRKIMMSSLARIRKSRPYKVAVYRLWQARMAPYFFVVNSRFARNIRGRKLTDEYSRGNRLLDDVQKDVLGRLERDGIALTHLDDFLQKPRAWESLATEASQRFSSQTVQGNTKKDFLLYCFKFLRGEDPALDLSSSFSLLAIEPRILGVVAAYFEAYPVVHFLSTALSQVVAGGQDRSTSQRWHRDPGVDRICKVFVYLTDVDEESGPFTYVPGSQPGGRLHRFFRHPFFGIGSYYPDNARADAALAANAHGSAIRICTGRAGTMIFCNTLGLHRGGYATARDRIMFTADYQRFAPQESAKKAYLSDEKLSAAYESLPAISKRALG